MRMSYERSAAAEREGLYLVGAGISIKINGMTRAVDASFRKRLPTSFAFGFFDLFKVKSKYYWKLCWR